VEESQSINPASREGKKEKKRQEKKSESSESESGSGRKVESLHYKTEGGGLFMLFSFACSHTK